jgi:spore maturation protein CgeB
MKTPERVLIVHPGPQFSVQDVFAGWQEAFCDLGIKCIDYNLQDRIAFYDAAYLYTGKHDGEGHGEFKKALAHKHDVIALAANGVMSTAYQFWPDLIIIVSAFFIPLDVIDTLRSRGHKVVLIFTESPYEESRQIEQATHADLVLLNDPLRLPEYDALGIPAFHIPHAYRPSLHYPGPGEDELATDFAFFGTGYPNRIEFFAKMIALGAFEGIDVTIGGNWEGCKDDDAVLAYLSHERSECVDNEIAVRSYRSAKVGMNLYRREAGRGIEDPVEKARAALGPSAAGPREIEMAACGLFFLRDPGPESDAIFPMLPSFASAEDAAEQLQWWLKRDDEREKGAREARAAIRHRTFTANAQTLLKMLDAL